MANIKRVPIRIDEKLHKILKFIAVEDNLTMQDMFLSAVDEKYSARIIKKEMESIEWEKKNGPAVFSRSIF